MARSNHQQFWFSAFRSVLSTLAQLPGIPADEMAAADWALLSESLPDGYTDTHVRELFYPDRESGAAAKRRPGFLSVLGDDAYKQVHERIRGTPRLRFVNVHSLLRTSKEDGRVMVQVLNHVIAWLNPSPTAVHNRRDNNKPPLWNDLVPALQNCKEECIQSAARRLNTKADELEGARAAAMLLQQEVLAFVRSNAAEFKSPTTKQYLDSMPGGTDGPAYAHRFLDRAWGHVLAIVRQYVGADFQRTWGTSPPGDLQGALLERRPSLTRAICKASETVPEIVQNPALNTKRALEALTAAIDETVLQWAVRQCQLALEDGAESTGTAWSAATVRQVREAQSKYAYHLAERTYVPPRASACSNPEREDAESTRVLTDTPAKPLTSGGSKQAGTEQEDAESTRVLAGAAAKPSTGGGSGQAGTESPPRPQRRQSPPARGLPAGNEERQVAGENPGRAALRPQPSPFRSSASPTFAKDPQPKKNQRPPAWTRGVKAMRHS
jgi:hypothetical protein